MSARPATGWARRPMSMGPRALTGVVLAAVTLVVLGNFRDYGISWDELIQHEYGVSVLAYYRSLGADRSAFTLSNLYLYGGLYEALAEAWALVFQDLGHFEARHLLNGLVGVAGIAGAWSLGRACGGARAGAWSALLLACTPTWVGHMGNNSKDIPFAVGYLWSVALLVRAHREYPRPRLATALLLGLAVGLAMAVRVGGLILWVFLGLSLGLWLLRVSVAGDRTRRTERWRAAPRIAAYALASASLSYAVMLSCWPWALHAPFSRPFEALEVFAHYVKGIPVSAGYLRQYAAKIPECIWVLAAVGAATGSWALRRRKNRISPRSGAYALLAAAAVVPLGYVLWRRSLVYDELRQFLFVQAILVVAAGCGAAALQKELQRWPAARFAAGLLAAGALAQLGLTMVRLHPYTYVYYNVASGGLRGAAERGLERDYWAHSYREAALWLGEQARAPGTGAERPLRIKVYGPSEAASYYFREGLAQAMTADDADYAVAIVRTRRQFPQPIPGQTVHTINRDGVTLCLVNRLGPAQPSPRAAIPPGSGLRPKTTGG